MASGSLCGSRTRGTDRHGIATFRCIGRLTFCRFSFRFTFCRITTGAACRFSAAGTSVPPFSVSLLSASFAGSSTTGVLAAAWDQRYTLPPVMIQIIVAGE